MDVGPLSALQQKQTDAASYDAVAEAFGRLSERLSASIADRLLSVASIEPAERVLDLGTGGGLLALRAARLTSHGKVVGVDHSEGMLEAASAKARRQFMQDRTQFMQMDAEALIFEPGSFDVVVSLFVLLHIPDPLKAAKELHRVLRPGGRVVIGVGGSAPLMSYAGLARAGVRVAQSLMVAQGRLVTAPAFMQHLLAEIGLRGHEAHVHDSLPARVLLRQAGFGNIRSAWAGSTFELTAEEFWDVCAIYGSNERVHLSRLSTKQLETLKERFMERSRSILSRNGKLIYRCGATIYSATRE